MGQLVTTTYATVLTRGTKSSFNNLPAMDGKIRFIVDSRELYIDYGNEHIKVSDIIDTYTESEMRELSLDKIITNKIYLTSDTKKMYMYVGTDWLNLIENHTHVVAQIVDAGSAARFNVPELGDAGNNQVVLGSDTRLSDARIAADVYPWAKQEYKPDYNVTEIINIGTAAEKDVPTSGDATNDEVVLGSDTRLSDARIASDVYNWAKQPTKPSYNVTEILNIGTAAERNVPLTGDATNNEVVLGNDSRLTDARIAADVYDWAKQPTKPGYDSTEIIGAGTVISYNVPVIGDATDNEVVLGNDSRLSDSRNAKDVYDWAKQENKPSYTKSEVGLSNVDNTSDESKKTAFTGTISSDSTGFVVGSSIYNALSEKLDSSEKGEPNGVAELDEHGHILASQLPGSVDEIKEGYYDKATGKFYEDTAHTIEIPGESDKIYLDVISNLAYRWGGTSFVTISSDISLGETETTAYRGDRGKIAYDHATDPNKYTTTTSVGFYKIGITKEGHIAGITAVSKSDITALGIPGSDTTYAVVSKTAAGLAPQLPNETTTTKYLRQDGSWQVPPDTTYAISKVDNGIKLSGSDGNSSIVTIDEVDTTYTLSKSGSTIKLTGSNGSSTSVTDANTTYALSKSGSTIILTGSDGATTGVTDSDTHRSIQVNGTEILGNNTTALNLKQGSNVSISNSNGTVTISATNTTYSVVSKTAAGLAPQLPNETNTSKYLRQDASWAIPENTTYTLSKSGSTIILTGSDGSTTGVTDSDTNNAVTQTNLANTDANARRIILSNSANDTSETKGVYKNAKLLYTPSTGFLSSPKLKSVINNSVITGTGTAAQDKGAGVSPRYFPAKWSFNTGFTPAEGDIITITIPVAGHPWGDWMSIDNGSTWHPVNQQGTGRLTTHFGAGQVIQLVFDADGQTNSMTPVAGADSVNGTNVTGGCWRVLNMYDSNTDVRPSAYCDTAAATAAKAASCTNYILLDKSYLHITMVYANSSASAITLNVNGRGAKAIYINGAASSASNYTLPAGTYLVYYASNIYYFRTDGKLTADITGNAATVNGLTVQTAVPSGAVFTDTKYNFSGSTFYSGVSGTAEHNANNIATNGVYYYSSNGPATSKGASTADGGLYAQFHSTTWGGQIAQDYRNGNLFIRGKNNGTYTEWSKVLNGFDIGFGRFGGTGNTTKIKIKINSILGWMLSFTVTLYQGYISRKIMISGYQYGSNHWYTPKAVLLGASDNAAPNVYFGYDSTNNLWVGFDGGNYTGVCISDVCNGYTQITDFSGLFTISNVSSLATIQSTITASKPDAATVGGLSLSLVT